MRQVRREQGAATRDNRMNVESSCPPKKIIHQPKAGLVDAPVWVGDEERDWVLPLFHRCRRRVFVSVSPANKLYDEVGAKVSRILGLD